MEPDRLHRSRNRHHRTRLLPLARYSLASFFLVLYMLSAVNEPQDHVDEILAQWRRERPDLNVAPLGLYGRLFRIVHLSDDALAKGLAPYGLQPGWFDLLAALRRAGASYELNPTHLMRATLLSSSGMTKRLDRMEAAGLIKRRPDPHDRRGTRAPHTRRHERERESTRDTHKKRGARAL